MLLIVGDFEAEKNKIRPIGNESVSVATQLFLSVFLALSLYLCCVGVCVYLHLRRFISFSFAIFFCVFTFPVWRRRRRRVVTFARDCNSLSDWVDWLRPTLKLKLELKLAVSRCSWSPLYISNYTLIFNLKLKRQTEVAGLVMMPRGVYEEQQQQQLIPWQVNPVSHHFLLVNMVAYAV